MSYTHLSRDDRVRLDTLLKTGLSLTGCAWNLGYSTPTVTSEVKKNGGRLNYDPYRANKKARLRRYSANQHHRKWTEENCYVRMAKRLIEKKNWSPEQILGRIDLEFKVTPFAASTVYLNVNCEKLLSKKLPRGHNKYRRTREGNDRKKFREEIDPRKSIEKRPKHINNRKTIGHWEGDTIIGKERTVRLLTHVERKTGYLLADLMKEVSAEAVKEASIRSFKKIPESKRKTTTYDRGSEFWGYEQLEQETGMQTYFAHAYHSWERGTSENTNGLLRRYFPKKTYFSNIEEKQLKKVVDEINHRPRKRLGYRSPYEKFWGVKLRMLI